VASPYAFIDPAKLTSKHVAQIRAWRVDQEMTWRAVAQAATDAWGSDHGSNQPAGEELCCAAAIALGEDPNSEPWN
jgi:hypothetical protein